MSDVASNVRQQQAAPKTLVGSIITLPLTLFGVLCGSLLMSVIVEIVGMQLFWKEQGWHHAEEMFYFELEQFSKSYTQSVYLSNPATTAYTMLETAHEWVFVKSGLLDEGQAVVTPQDTDSLRKLKFREFISMASGYFKDYTLAAAFTVLTFLVRLMVLFLSTPLAILAVFVGLIDGLVQRDIRRFTSEHESGFIYHRAKIFIIPLVVLPWMIYLALPFSIAPQLVLLPGAVLLGMAVSITASRFKKYL